MKKLVCMLTFFMVGALSLQAQNIGKASKAVQKSTSKARQKTGLKNPGVFGAVGKSVKQSAAPIGSSSSMPASSALQNQIHKTPKIPNATKVSMPDLSVSASKIKFLEQEEELLRKKIEAQQKANEAERAKQTQQMFHTEIGRSVLFAPVEAEGKTGGFSVTVISTNYQGKKEIFGVVASHVLPESYYTLRSSLQRKFHIQMMRDDGTVDILPAKVVQISPRSMLDVSLVKFSPEVEKSLIPLELSETSAEKNEKLFSTGFGAGIRQEEMRTVQKKSFLSVVTDQNLVGDRQGFCGSPLVDSNGKVKAIHTGTKEAKDAPDVSYGTHAKFVNLLIDAYHNEGKALYDLEIDKQTLARLNVDEYISAIYLYDANGKRILQKNVEDKFSQSFLERSLHENPQAAYLQLTTRKAQWEVDADGDSILKEDRSRSDKTKRQHWYNLQTRQIETSRPAIIKI